jgi:hypothetical protein
MFLHASVHPTITNTSPATKPNIDNQPSTIRAREDNFHRFFSPINATSNHKSHTYLHRLP